jgi:dTDP-glucose pyrophosphorylase
MISTQIIVTAVGNENEIFEINDAKIPKNLIPYDGSSILASALLEYSKISQDLTVILSKNEIDDFQSDNFLRRYCPNLNVIGSQRTAGALCSALLGLDSKKSEMPLIIAPGDSFTRSETQEAINYFVNNQVDAGTMVFTSSDSKYSFVRVNNFGGITEIAEKRVISELATTGLFYFKNAETFMEGARWALVNSSTHNNQYFVSHSFHRIISLGLKTSIYTLKSPANYENFKDKARVSNLLEGK